MSGMNWDRVNREKRTGRRPSDPARYMTRPPSKPKVFEARFAGWCCKCSKPYKVGVPIKRVDRDGSTKYAHALCPK